MQTFTIPGYRTGDGISGTPATELSVVLPAGFDRFIYDFIDFDSEGFPLFDVDYLSSSERRDGPDDILIGGVSVADGFDDGTLTTIILQVNAGPYAGGVFLDIYDEAADIDNIFQLGGPDAGLDTAAGIAAFESAIDGLSEAELLAIIGLPSGDFAAGTPIAISSVPHVTIETETAPDGATNGDDDLTAEAGAPLDGLGGDDTLTGTSGADTISGGNGNDEIEGLGGGDRLNGGKGADEIQGDDGDDRILGGQGADEISGGSGDDVINGGGQSDEINGGQGDDELIGKGGGDTIDAGVGDDTLKGGNGGDDLEGGGDDDEIDGGKGNDTLKGQKGDDLLEGGAGSDALMGDENDDTLDGGKGNDELMGGAGRDTFILDLRGGEDTIVDFEDNRDTIVLAMDLVGGDLGGRQILRRFGEQDGDDVVLTFDRKTMLTVEDTTFGELRNDIDVA